MSDYTLHEGFPSIRLQDGMVVRLNAIDPTTGNVVTGVTSSLWSIYGDDNSDDLTPGTPIVPAYSLEEDDDAGSGTPTGLSSQ